jgi:hypothetical protein
MPPDVSRCPRIVGARFFDGGIRPKWQSLDISLPFVPLPFDQKRSEATTFAAL